MRLRTARIGAARDAAASLTAGLIAAALHLPTAWMANARIASTPVAALRIPAARVMSAFLIVAILATSAACSMFKPKFIPPQLSIVSVQLERSDLFAQHLKVRMRVDNPNDLALPVEGLSYTLDVAGQEAAQGVSTASFTVPALGEAEFDMDVTANLAGTLLRLLSRGDSLSSAIDYHIAGKVRLSHGLLRSVPFDKRGTFTLR